MSLSDANAGVEIYLALNSLQEVIYDIEDCETKDSLTFIIQDLKVKEKLQYID